MSTPITNAPPAHDDHLDQRILTALRLAELGLTPEELAQATGVNVRHVYLATDRLIDAGLIDEHRTGPSTWLLTARPQ